MEMVSIYANLQLAGCATPRPTPHVRAIIAHRRVRERKKVNV